MKVKTRSSRPEPLRPPTRADFAFHVCQIGKLFFGRPLASPRPGNNQPVDHALRELPHSPVANAAMSPQSAKKTVHPNQTRQA